jgi:hydroxypyruvate reductase
VTLTISDVPGDDPAVIASGPTVPDPTTFADALAIMDKYAIHEPVHVLEHLRRGEEETPKPGDQRLSHIETIMIARPQASLEAAAGVARAAGFTPLILGDSLEGEARDVALVHAGIAKQVIRHRQPVPAPCVLLSGGETTVTVRGNGRGGRNAEFMLALAVALQGQAHIYAIACDTDGIDGTEDNAGALLTPDTLNRAEAAGLNAKAYLANNDGYAFFQQLNDLIMSGPTLTNVNDFRAILITDRADDNS